jgi:uncharacterized protein DUF1565
MSGVTSGLTSAPGSAVSAGGETHYLVTSLGDAGPGTLREAWERARVTGSAARILFGLAGVIRLSAALATNTGYYTILDGTDAPGPIILDGSAVAALSSVDAGQAPALVELRGHGHTLRGLTMLNPPHTAVRVVGSSAYDTLIEDCRVVNDDGRGETGGAFVLAGGARAVFRRCTATGAAREAGLVVGLAADDRAEGYWISGQVSATAAGLVMTGSGARLTLMDAGWTGASAALLRLAGGAAVSATSCLVTGSTGGSAAIEIDAAWLTLLRSTVTGISGAATPHGLAAGSTAVVLVQSSVITGCAGDGVRATRLALVDLGGGVRRSAGGNTLQGNGLVSGVDVYNAATRPLAAQGNTWDHPTVALVSALDVSSNVAIDPVA